MKKIKSSLILFLTFFLVSCGSANIYTETIINKDNISNMKVILTYDSLIKTQLGNNIIKDMINPNLEVNSSYNNKNNMYAEEISLSKEDINKLLLDSKLKDYLLVEKHKSTSLFKDIYTFDIKFLSDLSSIVDSNLASYLKFIPFTNRIVVSGKVLSSNSNNVVNENTLEWSYTLDQISTNTNLKFQYEEYNTFRIILFVLTLAILILIIIFFIKKNRAQEKSIN